MIRSILKSLQKPEAYPEPTSKVELVQTHVSWVFLTDNHAYKVKKPVDFGFLNFSTIDRRRFYCNEEIKYNRRLCPSIYVGVVELRQTPTGAAFMGSGQVIDYAVKMKRLPADRMLDRLIANDKVSADELRQVAKTIADFHLSAPSSPAIAEYGSLDRIRYNWNENFDQSVAFRNSTLPPVEREIIKKWVSAYITQYADLFQKRISGGFIRECDGDIHLENICLVNGSVYIFDCIEFCDRFRCCDTASDVAFLLMDLDFHKRRDLTQEVLATYRDASGDNEISEVIDFYKIYRAFVRGKIESFHALDNNIDQKERNISTQKAIHYFRLARGYIERTKLQTTLFITCGLMGCGKSTLVEQLIFELGIPSYNSDTIRKQLAGLPPSTPAPAGFNEGIYCQGLTQSTYDELYKLAEQEVSRNNSVIIDACFIHKSVRRKFSLLANRFGVRFVILHISCTETINRRRLATRLASGRSVSDGRLELLIAQRQAFQPPEAAEGQVIPIRTMAPPSILSSLVYERLS